MRLSCTGGRRGDCTVQGPWACVNPNPRMKSKIKQWFNISNHGETRMWMLGSACAWVLMDVDGMDVPIGADGIMGR